ncbi:transformer-2 protein homolog alpha isoform X1 [Vanessa tameamea]|uniref:Transformer-2 protein homolog alpha isoform X1 n=1 Tax=Vanessa tameamea TaxID=334116 RepID=A0A8B8HTK3_VANTA|nr:transformer-2 protein homolog alpha isoform X1 [Vanessa tameamea]XP_046965979.1 transformer-2 protein homolog alpha isoform X1 [Vanessa cardui]XP_047533088.1 transformer-2 protein homolog alpha isoform X1 [Vanessa atalanta]
MSDRERSRSRTRNGSREPAPKAAAMSRGHSRSRSRTPPPPKASSRKYRSPTRSRSGSPRRGYRGSRYSRSRSRSYSPRGSYRRSHSHSPMSSRRRHLGDRVRLLENPTPSRCLGVFGLSLYTTEQQIHHIFSKYGPVDKVQVVIDAKTGRSRGFCFVYFESQDDAKVAKNECTGMEIDGRRIRVDYSITQRAHTPTPGIYMGKPTHVRGDNGYDRRRDRDSDYYYRGSYRERERDYYARYRHRSPSPHYRRRRYERERSYSPRIETRSKG